MSWGERSCAIKRPCPHNPTMESCNVDCKHYVWDETTKPDSEHMSEAFKKLVGYAMLGKMARKEK